MENPLDSGAPKNLAEQFNSGHQEYTSFIESDPIRNFLHYPSVIKELGGVDGKKVLDIGCGDGLFDRRLARDYKASVVGYDISANLIEKAEREERESPLGIKYINSDPTNFQSAEPFDFSVAVMVLPYSPDASYIKNFFSSAYRNLRVGGKFVAVVFNPGFQDFDEQVGNRFFRRGDGNRVNFDFLDVNNSEVKFNANLTQYSKNDYEKAIQDGGFSKFEWKSLSPDEEGVKKLGDKFWDNLVKKQPYSLIVAEK